MDDFEGFKPSVERVTADVVGTAGELQLQEEPEDGTELLPPQDKTLTDEKSYLMYEQMKWFLDMASPDEDVVRLLK